MRPLIIVVLAVALSACRSPQANEVPSENTATENPGPRSPAPQSYADLVARVAPAVVTVRSARRVHPPQQTQFQNDPFFRWLFGNLQRGNGNQGDQTELALGSGVIVEADGHILTNDHVVNGAQEIHVDLNDGRTLSAKLVGADALSDLAVLKVDASNLPVLSLGDSDKVRVGDVCLAIGNPLGIGETVTNGIISAKGRTTGLSDGSFQDFLQTDAPINKGNSGGALVNTAAELIGINSEIISTTGASIGLGFAIPSNMARNVMNQLIHGGKVRRGELGITIQPLTSDLAAALHLKDTQGVLISSVVANGPAQKAGIRSGDVVTALNGTPIHDPNSFRNVIAGTPPGTDVALTIMRDGQQQQMKVKLEELQPGQQNAQNGGPGGPSAGQLGITVQPVTPAIAAQLNLPSNTQGLVVVSVDPAGAAAESGLQSGDVIVQVNRQAVRSIGDLQSAIAKSGSGPVLLLINRQGQTMFVTISH